MEARQVEIPYEDLSDRNEGYVRLAAAIVHEAIQNVSCNLMPTHRDRDHGKYYCPITRKLLLPNAEEACAQCRKDALLWVLGDPWAESLITWLGLDLGMVRAKAEELYAETVRERV